MALAASERYALKKFIKELDQYRAAHTEFVTVYVPVGYDLVKIIQHLAQEQGTATNIKSAQTRNNVIDALERMIQHLRIVQRTPPHGLAAFSGNILSREGKTDVRVWSIEPPVPLNTRSYMCDKNFDLEILRQMLQEKEVFGLVIVDARDAFIALLRGKTIVPLVKTHSHIPGKMKAGGQSAVRFARNREIAVKEHFKKVADHMKEQFFGMDGLKGILVGGPGPTKYEFVEGNTITTDLKKKIIGIRDLSYTDEFGLNELVDKSQDVLAAEEIADEKKIMNLFFEKLAKNPKIVTYGEENTRKAIELGAVDVLLLSEALDETLMDAYDALARQYGTTVKIISTETREGVQLKELGKIASILRYEVHV